MTKDWEQYRNEITHLYIRDGLKLDDVKKYMSEAYDFTASIRSYRQHFDEWQIGKYNCKKRRHWKDRQPSRMLHRQRQVQLRSPTLSPASSPMGVIPQTPSPFQDMTFFDQLAADWRAAHDARSPHADQTLHADISSGTCYPESLDAQWSLPPLHTAFSVPIRQEPQFHDAFSFGQPVLVSLNSPAIFDDQRSRAYASSHHSDGSDLYAEPPDRSP